MDTITIDAVKCAVDLVCRHAVLLPSLRSPASFSMPGRRPEQEHPLKVLPLPEIAAMQLSAGWSTPWVKSWLGRKRNFYGLR